MKPERNHNSRSGTVIPGKDNVCAVVVTYFPDLRFGERLERIRKQVAKTIIVDNTSQPISFSSMDFADVELIVNAENMGVGEALNQGVLRAKQLGYEWVLTFDQDSWIDQDLVSSLSNIYKEQSHPEVIGIIGCNYRDQNVGIAARKCPASDLPYMDVDTVITSGSLLRVSVFTKVGPFRSDFFIDYIDHEYCLRLNRLGYKVICSTCPLMIHSLGEANKVAFGNRLDKLNLISTNRSPMRRYYMTRNTLLVAKEYLSFKPSWVLKSLASTVVFATLKIALEDSNRTRKLLASLYGIVDALRSKTGRASSSWLQEIRQNSMRQ